MRRMKTPGVYGWGPTYEHLVVANIVICQDGTEHMDQKAVF